MDSKNHQHSTEKKTRKKSTQVYRFSTWRDSVFKQDELETMGDDLINYVIKNKQCLTVNEFRIKINMSRRSWDTYYKNYPAFKERVDEANSILGMQREKLMAFHKADRHVIGKTQWKFCSLWKESEEREIKIKKELEDDDVTEKVLQTVLRNLVKEKKDEKETRDIV